MYVHIRKYWVDLTLLNIIITGDNSSALSLLLAVDTLQVDSPQYPKPPAKYCRRSC